MTLTTSFRRLLILLTLCIAATTANGRASTPDSQQVEWQQATSADMRLFAPYIGTWQSGTRIAPNGADVYFLIDYQWYDSREQIVRLRIRQVLDGVETVSSDGFYGIHPTEPRIYYFISGPSGMFGIGGVATFELTTARRTNRAIGRGPDGVVVNLRDDAEMIDADRWKATTSMLQDGAWNVVREDTFTRVPTPLAHRSPTD